MQRIGVVGLGVMGSAMSSHLIKAGYELHGYDVVPERNQAFAAMGGTVEASGAG